MLEEKILADYREAMKTKDRIKSSVLSFLRAELMNTAIAKKKKQLDDNEVVAVIKKQAKNRADSIEQFRKGSRQDLADKEAAELEILKSYLPEELGTDEVKKIIKETIASTGAQGPKDMGKVMKELAIKIAGRCEGKLLSEIVREQLGGQAAVE